MRTSKARTGLRAGLACHRSWNAYGKYLPSHTQGGSRMRESRTYGSVRGARGNSRPYREHFAAVHESGLPPMRRHVRWRRAYIRPLDGNSTQGALASPADQLLNGQRCARCVEGALGCKETQSGLCEQKGRVISAPASASAIPKGARSDSKSGRPALRPASRARRPHECRPARQA